MTLFDFTIINGYLLLFWIVFQLLNTGKQHTIFNRWYLLLSPILSIIFTFLPSSGKIEVSNQIVAELAQITVFTQTAHSTTTSLTFWITLIYLIGCLSFLLLFVRNLIQVFRKQDVELLNTSEGITIYLLTSERSSYSFFNRIYLNENQLENSDVILLHERAHCLGWHSLDSILYAIFRSAFWFNPIIYFLDKASKENHEFIADQYVLNHSVDAKTYGFSLLAASFNCSIPELGKGFNPKSLLLKRIQHLKFKNHINMKHVFIVPAIIAGLVITTTSMTCLPKKTGNLITPTTFLKGDENVIPAEFEGGKDAMISYLGENIIYPEALKEQRAEALIHISFVISPTGKVKKVKVEKASDYTEFDLEAKRVISEMPDWKPATKNGKPVSFQMTLPILFKMA